MPRAAPLPVFATEAHEPPATPTARLWRTVVVGILHDAARPCTCPRHCLRAQALVDAGRRDLRELVAPLGLVPVLRSVARLPVCEPKPVTAARVRPPARRREAEHRHAGRRRPAERAHARQVIRHDAARMLAPVTAPRTPQLRPQSVVSDPVSLHHF
jgi:hypothetical protein